MKSKKTKIDQIVEYVRQHKVVSVSVLAEKVYGKSTQENIRKLQHLIVVYRINSKSENIYCIQGNVVDISSLFKNKIE